MIMWFKTYTDWNEEFNLLTCFDLINTAWVRQLFENKSIENTPTFSLKCYNEVFTSLNINATVADFDAE